MTFNTEVKNEIILSLTKKPCCLICHTLGLLLYSTDYSDEKIGIKTENAAVAEYYAKMLRDVAMADVVIKTTKSDLRSVYAAQKDLRKILNNFNLSVCESLLKCEECRGAFLKGAFLTGGKISSPTAEYRLEFVSKNDEISCFLYRILFESALCPKMTIKNKKVSVYLKDSEGIEDLLTLLGAVKSAISLMNTKILKDIRNNTNRKSNFEVANIKKTATSSSKQITAIEKLQKEGVLNTLPDDTKALALARVENYELSLSELGEMFNLSRSGVYHRLKKLCEMAEEL